MHWMTQRQYIRDWYGGDEPLSLLLASGQSGVVIERPAMSSANFISAIYVLQDHRYEQRASHRLEIVADDSEKALYRLSLRYKKLNWRTELVLLHRFRQGDMEARDTLVKHNIWRLLAYAEYLPMYSLPDLFQEAAMGFMRAIEKYDFSRNRKFFRYGRWWIVQRMQRYVENCERTIRLPTNIYWRLRRVQAALNRFGVLYSGLPIEIELSADLGLSIDEVKVCLDLLKNFDLTSLELLLEDTELADAMTVDRLQDPEMEAENTELIEFTETILQCLSARSQLILRLRFGLDGFAPCTLQEIGDLLGLTRERIRQIEDKAFCLLREKFSEQATALLSPEKDMVDASRDVDQPSLPQVSNGEAGKQPLGQG